MSIAMPNGPVKVMVKGKLLGMADHVRIRNVPPEVDIQGLTGPSPLARWTADPQPGDIAHLYTLAPDTHCFIDLTDHNTGRGLPLAPIALAPGDVLQVIVSRGSAADQAQELQRMRDDAQRLSNELHLAACHISDLRQEGGNQARSYERGRADERREIIQWLQASQESVPLTISLVSWLVSKVQERGACLPPLPPEALRQQLDEAQAALIAEGAEVARLNALIDRLQGKARLQGAVQP